MDRSLNKNDADSYESLISNKLHVHFLFFFLNSTYLATQHNGRSGDYMNRCHSLPDRARCCATSKDPRSVLKVRSRFKDQAFLSNNVSAKNLAGSADMEWCKMKNLLQESLIDNAFSTRCTE